MILDLNLILASAAVLAAIGALIAVFTQKKSAHRWQEAVETGIYHVKKTCDDRAVELRAELETHVKESLAAFEAAMSAPDHALAAGRLSRSSRSEALRLLRSGIAPETAASTLGMPKNDIELLAKVSSVLTAR